MYSNIVPTGGNCLFKNFKERICQDIRSDCLDFINIAVEFPENSINYAWQGGQILSELLNNDDYIKKTDFYEQGPSRISQNIFNQNYHPKNNNDLEIIGL
ncbi:hypothetical protein HZS_1129 [Henneguya salminicola]|nr:hypothetical protein HZS_1129 [Henneguya salminicola]